MIKSVVYVIPGFMHSTTRKEYKNVAKFFEEKGIEVVFVQIDWKYKTISDWVEQFLTKYHKNDKRKKYLFGFSYGAMIAFISSLSTEINTQILCSLSPYFHEDLPGLPAKWKKGIGKRRVKDFNKLNMSILAPKVKTKTYLLYGTKEGKYIEKRANDVFQRLKCEKYLMKVKDAKHDIGNKEYLKQIQKIVEKLE